MSSNREIAGILLAGGSSSRLGKPKQMVTWQGKFLVNHIIDIIRRGDIENLQVVLGHQFDLIKQIIEDKKANIINNQNWQSGISSSIKAGITSLDKDILGTFIFVVDQPFLSEDLIRKMKSVFMNGEAEIVAPRVNGQQCNPVLFHQKLFKDLILINGNNGGKKLITKGRTHWIDWTDERLLLDIDSSQDYLLACKLAG